MYLKNVPVVRAGVYTCKVVLGEPKIIGLSTSIREIKCQNLFQAKTVAREYQMHLPTIWTLPLSESDYL